MSKATPLIIIDNGHGASTPGKCSPDGALREYAWNREVAKKIAAMLEQRGLSVHLLVPTDRDVPLKERVATVNALCKANGGSASCVLVSVHVNAASNGGWHSARGWSVFVSPNASARSRALAEKLAAAASSEGLTVRRQYPGKGYWVQSLAMVRDTLCPAALTENLFMDNHDDCNWILTEDGKDTVARLHADALERYCREAS